MRKGNFNLDDPRGEIIVQTTETTCPRFPGKRPLVHRDDSSSPMEKYLDLFSDLCSTAHIQQNIV